MTENTPKPYPTNENNQPQISSDGKVVTMTVTLEGIAAQRRAFSSDKALLERFCAMPIDPADAKHTVLLVATNGTMVKLRYDLHHYDTIENAVGGACSIEPVWLSNGMHYMAVNSNAFMRGMTFNPVMEFGVIEDGDILGNVVFAEIGCLNGRPDLVGLTEAEAQRLGDEFVEWSSGYIHWGETWMDSVMYNSMGYPDWD